MKKKSIDNDMLTIKEFAKYVGITTSALRHYDKVGAFEAAERGDGSSNTYRFYSPVQITTAKMVRVLREAGVPLNTIIELKDNRTPEMVLKLLNKHSNLIAEKVRMLQETISVIDIFSGLINEAVSANENDITVATVPKRQIILGKRTDYIGETGFMREFLQFCNDSHIPRLNMSFPIGGFWNSMDDFLLESTRPEQFFSLDPNGQSTWESNLSLIGYTRGYYGQTNDLPERMVAYAEKNGLAFNGPVYNIYVSDEISVADPSQYLLQVSASVTKERKVNKTRSVGNFE